MDNKNSFWRGKKVFLTGHTGFKGSWLSLWLQHQQADVTGFALAPPTPINLFTAAQVADGMTDIRGDIRDFDALKSALQQHQPDILIHMAAQPLVRYSYSNPVETYATNVMGTVHVLEAARHCPNLRAIVNVTTDKCYENKERELGYREDEPMGGHDPYSNSKGCAELVTSAYRKSFLNEIGLATARAGNVIGGGDWALDRLVPDLVTACVDQRTLQIRYPNAIRPWQHVLEPLSGYLHLAEKLYHSPNQYSEAWNFGPEASDAKPVAWIADEVLRLWGGKMKWQLAEGAQLHEATYLKLDCTKANQQLQWLPQWNIKNALEATVSWYREYYDGQDARQITIEQIETYSRKLP